MIGAVLLVATLWLGIRRSLGKVSRDHDQQFVLCVLVWTALNLVLESFLITGCFFATFLTLTCLARIGFTRNQRRRGRRGRCGSGGGAYE